MSKRTKKVHVRKILRERARQQRQADDVVPPAPPRKQLKKKAVTLCDCGHERDAHSTTKFGGGCILCNCTAPKEAI